MFTQKHYVEIAEVLKNKYAEVQRWNSIEAQSLTLAYIEDFAGMLQKDNPKFDKDKFYKFINPNFLF